MQSADGVEATDATSIVSLSVANYKHNVVFVDVIEMQLDAVDKERGAMQRFLGVRDGFLEIDATSIASLSTIKPKLSSAFKDVIKLRFDADDEECGATRSVFAGDVEATDVTSVASFSEMKPKHDIRFGNIIGLRLNLDDDESIVVGDARTIKANDTASVSEPIEEVAPRDLEKHQVNLLQGKLMTILIDAAGTVDAADAMNVKSLASPIFEQDVNDDDFVFIKFESESPAVDGRFNGAVRPWIYKSLLTVRPEQEMIVKDENGIESQLEVSQANFLMPRSLLLTTSKIAQLAERGQQISNLAFDMEGFNDNRATSHVLAYSSKSKQCLICHDEVNENFPLTGCVSHRTCVDCWDAFMFHSVMNSNSLLVKPRCVNHDCTTYTPADTDINSPIVFERLLQNRSKHAQRELSTSRCPICLTNDALRLGPLNKRLRNRLHLDCTQCHGKVCLFCRSAVPKWQALMNWHVCPSKPCADLLRLTRKTKKIKPCPHCLELVHRYEGCRNMQCRCTKSFCYDCLNPSLTHDCPIYWPEDSSPVLTCLRKVFNNVHSAWQLLMQIPKGLMFVVSLPGRVLENHRFLQRMAESRKHFKFQEALMHRGVDVYFPDTDTSLEVILQHERSSVAKHNRPEAGRWCANHRCFVSYYGLQGDATVFRFHSGHLPLEPCGLERPDNTLGSFDLNVNRDQQLEMLAIFPNNQVFEDVFASAIEDFRMQFEARQIANGKVLV